MRKKMNCGFIFVVFVGLSLCCHGTVKAEINSTPGSCKESGCPGGQKCILDTCVLADAGCPAARKFGIGPPSSCQAPSDPNNKPSSDLESWFTKEVFNDLFPKANIGWGPNKCWPYSYESFVIAARYFPRFGTESSNNGYSARENNRRELAAFFAHAVQETGENDAGLYNVLQKKQADDCYYRGGFYNWFEGGPVSSFLRPASPGYQPIDGEQCNQNGIYCSKSAELDYFFPCSSRTAGSGPYKHKGCYFGRGAIQISYNFNYGLFDDWLKGQNINVDLLANPNLVMTKMNPPLAVLASLWFYMTPQPPKPAMHDIILGNWESGSINKAAGYHGPIFGPTSLIINNECGGEDKEDPGGPGESRRIKAFKWFTKYFKVPIEDDKLLTCKGMPVMLDRIEHGLSYQPDWSTTWKEEPCNCAPATYGGMIPYFQTGFYPQRFVESNEKNRMRCVMSIYDKPSLYGMNPGSSACLNFPPGGTTKSTTKATRTTKPGTTPPTQPTITTTTKGSTNPPSSTVLPTGSGEIVATVVKSGEWQDGEGRIIMQIGVTLRNTGSAKACNIIVMIQPSNTPIQSFWGLESQGQGWTLPGWVQGIDPGVQHFGIGLIVVSESVPSFVVSAGPC